MVDKQDATALADELGYWGTHGAMMPARRTLLFDAAAALRSTSQTPDAVREVLEAAKAKIAEWPIPSNITESHARYLAITSRDEVLKRIDATLSTPGGDNGLGCKCEDVARAVLAARPQPQPVDRRGACDCGIMCQDLGKDAGCRYLKPERETLRKLVDIVYQHATESEAVPATLTADLLIDRAFAAVPLADGRGAVIEECAQIAEAQNWCGGGAIVCGDAIARRIRALQQSHATDEG